LCELFEVHSSQAFLVAVATALSTWVTWAGSSALGLSYVVSYSYSSHL